MIEAMVPRAAASRFASLSDDLEVLGSWQEVLEGELVLLRVLVRSDRAEPVVNELEKRFTDCPDFRIVLFEAEATLPAEPAPEPAEEDDAPEDKPEPARVAVAELVEKLTAGTQIDRTYVLTVLLSTVVAAIGLVRDNVAVIIGAMVIAPLLTPNMALAAATTLGDAKLARQALWVTGAGVSMVLTASMVLGLFVPFDPRVPELARRGAVGLSDVALALAAGSAGALAFTTGVSAALVGVMVAVALLPPLVAVGLFVGAGEWGMGGQALLLVAANVICVNLAAIGTFVMQGVRPHRFWDAERARKMVRVAAGAWIVLLALLLGLIALVAGR